MAEQQALPIDVNYQKLAEWLVQRQKLPTNWHKMLQVIQAKMSEAVKQLPASLLSTLDLGKDSALDYFAAAQISKALDAQEGSRNMLGVRTGSAAVWEKVVKAYEKNLLYVGEACQTMIQNADHEIPFLRKQAVRYSQLVSDGEKKQAELLKAATASASAYKEECSKLGIEGVNVRTELQLLARQLPGMFLEVVEKLRQSEIQQAVDYYLQFAAFAHELPEGFHDRTLGVLKQVLMAEESDRWEVLQDATTSTTVDWDVPVETASASAPAVIDWDVMADTGNTATTAGVDINWDVGASAGGEDGTAAPPGIDWEVVTGDDQTAGIAGGINWDIDVAAEGTVKAVEGDWDVDLRETGEGAVPLEVNWNVGEVETGHQGGTVGEPDTGDAAGAVEVPSSIPSSTAHVVQRLQNDAEYRAQLLDDVQELGAFLAMRKSELQSSGADILLAMLPEVLQHIDKERVGIMTSGAEGAKNLMLSGRLRQLLLIVTSPQYLDRLVRTLELKAGHESRLIASHKEVEARRNESILALKELQPKIQTLVAKTRGVKAAVESTLASQFAGRRINVLGDINVVLAQSG